MITVTRRLEFDAAHRVLGHEGKCRYLHGHRYIAEVSARSFELDAVGRVVDFGVIKEKIGGWIDATWDHNSLFHPDDPLVAYICESGLERTPYTMRSGNPTAENIALELYGVACKLLPSDMIIVRIRVWETPNCFADFIPSVEG